MATIDDDVRTLDFRNLIEMHGATQVLGLTMDGAERTAYFEYAISCLDEAMVRFDALRSYLGNKLLTRDQYVHVWRIINGGHTGGLPMFSMLDFVEPE